VTGNDLTWTHVTGSDPEVTSFDVKSRGSTCKRPIRQVLSTFELLQAVTAGGGSHFTGKDLTWPHVTESHPELTSFDRKSTASGCRRPISQVLGMFELLQGCNSQEVAHTWQEMTSVTPCDWKWPGSDVIWPEVTWKWL